MLGSHPGCPLTPARPSWDCGLWFTQSLDTLGSDVLKPVPGDLNFWGHFGTAGILEELGYSWRAAQTSSRMFCVGSLRRAADVCLL